MRLPSEEKQPARSLRTQQRAEDQGVGFEVFLTTVNSGCTGLTNLRPGHNVNVPPMSATEERVSPKWLGS